MELHCLSSCPPSYRLQLSNSGETALSKAIQFDCPVCTCEAALETRIAQNLDAVLVSSCAGLAGIPLLTEKMCYCGPIFVPAPVATASTSSDCRCLMNRASPHSSDLCFVTMQLGSWELEERIRASAAGHRPAWPYTLAQLRRSRARWSLVGPGQPVAVADGITVTPFPSGLTFGGVIWWFCIPKHFVTLNAGMS